MFVLISYHMENNVIFWISSLQFLVKQKLGWKQKICFSISVLHFLQGKYKKNMSDTDNSIDGICI